MSIRDIIGPFRNPYGFTYWKSISISYIAILILCHANFPKKQENSNAIILNNHILIF